MSQSRRLLRRARHADPSRAAFARLEHLERSGVFSAADARDIGEHLRQGLPLHEAILALGATRLDAAIARTEHALPELARRIDALTARIQLVAART